MKDSTNKKEYTKKDALLAMADLCAGSEQCAFDISRKLMKKGLSSADIHYVIQELRERSFIDDFRYARSFARDKVRFSGWGKNKIRAALAMKRIPDSIVREAFEEVEYEDYFDAAMRAVKSKSRGLDVSNYEDKMKVVRYLATKGFESNIIFEAIKEFQSE